MTRTGSLEPKKGRRRLHAAADVVAAALLATGALLVGISVSQHQHHGQALAAQAARKAQIEQAAKAEAQQFRAAARPQAHQVNDTAKVERARPAEAQPLGEAALVLAADRQLATAPAPRHSPPPRPRPSGVTAPAAVSEVRGPGATLVIPAVGVRAPVVATGAVNGSMTIPADIHTVGWYDGTESNGGATTSAHTPWPGQPGVSLLAGHVDWAGEGPVLSTTSATSWPATRSKSSAPTGRPLTGGSAGRPSLSPSPTSRPTFLSTAGLPSSLWSLVAGLSMQPRATTWTTSSSGPRSRRARQPLGSMPTRSRNAIHLP